jgi:hypothetical protein
MAGTGASVSEDRLAPWHSATFVGTQHRLTLTIEGNDARGRADRLAAALPEASFTLGGHIVVDAVVDAVSHDARDQSRLHLCLLTIEEW